MTGNPLGTAIRRLLRHVSAPPGAGVSDAELLDRFVQRRDETAIETLLWRHGPMVLRTCRRLLGSLPDAEDCFQATFLVLCRKAQSIAGRQSLGGWLYKVAYRVCLRARAARRRQPVALPDDVEPLAGESISPLAWQELRAVLDEELNRLPEKYRAPLVLHYLEGKTVEQVAAELAWPFGTVCVCLTRGKDQLRGRLAKRGMTLTAGALTVVLAQETAAGALPPALARSTINALFAGAISRTSAILAQEFMRTQLLGRLKWVFALLIAIGTAATGAGVILSGDRPELSASSGSLSDLGAVLEGPSGADPDGDAIPPGAIRRLGSARFRQIDRTLAAAYSTNGRTLTTAGQSGLIHTWDAATGRLRDTFHVAGPSALALSADARFAATYEPLEVEPRPVGGQIKLRRVSDGKILQALAVPQKAEIATIAFSRNGKRVAAAGYFDFLLVWDVATGKLLRRLPAAGWQVRGSQLQVGLSPDGKLLAAFDSHPTIRLWDVETGVERSPLLIEGSLFSAFAFSGDGRILVCGNLAGQISLWDTQSGKLIRSFRAQENQPPAKQVKSSEWSNRVASHGGFSQTRETPMRGLEGVTSLAISNDGKLLVCCGESGIGVWDAATGQERGQLQPADLSGSREVPLAFSPDDKFIVAGDSSAQIKVWEVATGRRILAGDEPDLDRQNDHTCFAAISPDGTMAATFRSGFIQFWDVRTGQKTGAITAGNVDGHMSQPITFSADCKYLLRPYHKVNVANVLSGRTKDDAAWIESPLPRPPEVMVVMHGHYGGHYNDFRIVRRVATGSVPALPQVFGSLRPIAFSPDGKTVAWEGDKASMIVLCDWKTGEGNCRVSCPGPCQSASFAPDGKSLAVAGESYVGLWDVDSGSQIRELAKMANDRWRGLGEHFRPLAFSPDGKFLVASDADCEVLVWNVATGKTAAVFKGHGGPIMSVAFTADGRRLISGSADSTALIWDTSQLIKENGP